MHVYRMLYTAIASVLDWGPHCYRGTQRALESFKNDFRVYIGPGG